MGSPTGGSLSQYDFKEKKNEKVIFSLDAVECVVSRFVNASDL
jgi:hypothetical protein